jgi:hypothetical protein
LQKLPGFLGVRVDWMSVLAEEKKPGWQKTGFHYRLDVGFSGRK